MRIPRLHKAAWKSIGMVPQIHAPLASRANFPEYSQVMNYYDIFGYIWGYPFQGILDSLLQFRHDMFGMVRRSPCQAESVTTSPSTLDATLASAGQQRCGHGA